MISFFDQNSKKNLSDKRTVFADTGNTRP